MTVDKEHVQYEFDMLTLCVEGILQQKSSFEYSLYNNAGFLAAANL